MKIVTAQDPDLLTWAEKRLGVQFQADLVTWVAGLADGGIVFVVVYSQFSTRSCELTIATDGSKRWATKRSLREIFRRPFALWDLRRVHFVVSVDNAQSLDLCKRLGAVEEGRVRCAFPGDVDGILLGMLREEGLKWT